LLLVHHSYDSSADIWSFGITLLELAQGRVPLARQNPLRVMMATLAGPAPSLEDDPQSGRVYSKVWVGGVG
jgi:serine/threonine-protein kinase OSR1/STK39